MYKYIDTDRNREIQKEKYGRCPVVDNSRFLRRPLRCLLGSGLRVSENGPAREQVAGADSVSVYG